MEDKDTANINVNANANTDADAAVDADAAAAADAAANANAETDATVTAIADADANTIVELFFARDEDALRQSEKQYARYLWQIAFNILSNSQDAEECVNDTWVRAWNSIPPARPENLGAFLGKITRNLALDRYKAGHAEKRGGGEYAMSLDELAEVLPDRETPCPEEYLGEVISRFLRTQSPACRKVFVCRYFYTESIEDISRRFGFGQSKVKSMLHRTRNRLKSYLEQEGISL